MKKMRIFVGKERMIRKALVDLYRFYFRQARSLKTIMSPTVEEKVYVQAKADGSLEAISELFKILYGDRELYSLWQVTMAECDRKDRLAEQLAAKGGAAS